MDRQLQRGHRLGGDGQETVSRTARDSSGAAEKINVEFEAGPTAAAAARNALFALEGRMDETLLSDVRLLVSELVTNSVRHAEIAPHAHVWMEVRVTPNTVRVEVADSGNGFEVVPRDTDRSRPGGWGLYLVDRLTDRWGVARNNLTRVWFEIDQPQRARAA